MRPIIVDLVSRRYNFPVDEISDRFPDHSPFLTDPAFGKLQLVSFGTMVQPAFGSSALTHNRRLVSRKELLRVKTHSGPDINNNCEIGDCLFSGIDGSAGCG
jgi:hypothetical protein